jgi:hypothetical protein
MNFNLYTKVQINLYEKVQTVFEMRKKLTIWGILTPVFKTLGEGSQY